MMIRLLKHENHEKLISDITKHVNNGWQMQGGISVAQNEESRGSIGMYWKAQVTYYYQTMIKEVGHD